MTRIALISDVHGNWPALAAVIAHARRHHVDQFLGAGDWVGGGDEPNQVLDWLRQSGTPAIAGNYDLAVLEVPAKRQQWPNGEPPPRWKLAAWTWTLGQLTTENAEYLSRMPTWLRLNVEGKRLLVVHISPGEEVDLLPDTPPARFRDLARQVDADVVILGHTHQPLARRSGKVWFVNPGSVGRPRDGQPMADYAILSVGSHRVQVTHYRLPYDGPVAKRAPVDDLPSVPAGPRHHVGREGKIDSALALARSCHFEEQHTHQVTRLALRLFDELPRLHGLGPTERFWLESAALLHDIGLIEGSEGHHKTSLRLILESSLLEFTAAERLIIANVARYHRAALPAERHKHFARVKPAARRTVCFLASILRLADGLDVSHGSVVKDLTCSITPHAVRVDCTTSGPATAEKARALEKGDLFEQTFGCTLAFKVRPE